MKYYDIERNKLKLIECIQTPNAKKKLMHRFKRHLRKLTKEAIFTDAQLESTGAITNFIDDPSDREFIKFNKFMAKLMEPNTDWCIVGNKEHAVVWDRHETIFDCRKKKTLTANEAFLLVKPDASNFSALPRYQVQESDHFDTALDNNNNNNKCIQN